MTCNTRPPTRGGRLTVPCAGSGRPLGPSHFTHMVPRYQPGNFTRGALLALVGVVLGLWVSDNLSVVLPNVTLMASIRPPRPLRPIGPPQKWWQPYKPPSPVYSSSTTLSTTAYPPTSWTCIACG